MGDLNDIQRLQRESRIMDEGYNAVRKMAKEMIKNGATLSDIVFHANQVWHEFKVGAIEAGMMEVVQTGMYIAGPGVPYNAEKSAQIIKADPRYANGTDSFRVAVLAHQLKQQPENGKAKAAAAGKTKR